MFRKMVLVLIGLTLVGTTIVGRALATPSSGVTAETARGRLDRELNLEESWAGGQQQVKIRTKGAMELVTQRIVAIPGATFGWHSHPGENVNVILRGTLTLYHDEACTEGIAYGRGTSFPTSPDEIHLARNEGTEELVLFATYFVPVSIRQLPIRIDRPSPGPECPL
jgi:quercetin dioxygenase-like cupin family protein